MTKQGLFTDKNYLIANNKYNFITLTYIKEKTMMFKSSFLNYAENVQHLVIIFKLYTKP